MVGWSLGNDGKIVDRIWHGSSELITDTQSAPACEVLDTRPIAAAMAQQAYKRRLPTTSLSFMHQNICGLGALQYHDAGADADAVSDIMRSIAVAC